MALEAIVDLLLWMLMFVAWKKKNKLLATLLLIASLAAFYGSLLSITRGAWLVYVFMIFGFVLYILKRSIFNKYYVFSKPVVLRIFFALILLLLVSQTEQFRTIEGRTVNALNILTEISQGKLENNSSVARVDIYRTAIEIARHFPFGVGTDNFRTGSKAVIILDAINNRNIVVKNQDNVVLDNDDLKGDIYKYHFLQSFNEDGSRKFTSRFRHAHNEWLNVLAENGVAGFILLTLLFTFPMKIFWENLTNENDLVGMYSYCGILLIVSFTIFSQTQSIFTSHAAVIFFIFFLFLFLAQISRLNNIDDNHDSIY